MATPILLRITQDPWGRTSTGRPPLHSVHTLLGRPKARVDAWGRRATGADPAPASPALPVAYGLTWAGSLLAYRKVWDPYVMGTVSAMLQAAKAYRQLAQGLAVDEAHTPAVTYPDASTYALLATTWEGSANVLLGDWNQFEGKPAWQISLFAGNYLQEYQRIVKRVGARDQPYVRAAFPKLPLPDPPGLDPQAEMIGALQGLNLTAQGTLQLLGIGSSGALEVLGTVSSQGGQVLGHAADAVITLTDMLPYVVAGVGLLALLVVAAAMTKSGSRSIASVASAVRPDPQRLPPARALPPDALVVQEDPLPASALPNVVDYDEDA